MIAKDDSKTLDQRDPQEKTEQQKSLPHSPLYGYMDN
jgi:hypothetical protein